jgi:hypothetical protein
MVSTPAERPITRPAPERLVTDGLAWLHVPPEEGSDKIMINPSQRACGPEIGSGKALTVIVAVGRQPAGVK